MSPASAGPLEVERYIGACLISSQNRNKSGIVNAQPPGNRDVYYPRGRYVQDVYNGTGYQVTAVDNRYRPRRCNSVDGWAGGMPLISFANNHRRSRRPDAVDTRSASPRVTEEVQVPTPLSRLAVHTQGLPLILSGRQNNRRNKNTGRRDGIVTPNRPLDGSAVKKDNSVRAVDSLSVASDESSGSNNSETSLPRIIKPRKRRKKDRKPHAVRPPGMENHQDTCIGSSSIVTLKPYVVPYCYTRDRVYPPSYINTYSSETDRSEKRVSVTDSDLSEAPQLHHRFEDVVGPETEIEPQQPSSCQCRYCDPAGQIWDVDRHCYSPFLTTPTFRHDHPTFVDPAATFSKKQLAEKISSALENQCLISTFSYDLDVSSSGDDSGCRDAEVTSRTTQCLEISTEIVTSHNGHRDLEIRLFSSSALGSRRLGMQPAAKVLPDTSNKCTTSERVCLVSDDCGLLPEE